MNLLVATYTRYVGNSTPEIAYSAGQKSAGSVPAMLTPRCILEAELAIKTTNIFLNFVARLQKIRFMLEKSKQFVCSYTVNSKD